MIRNFKKDFNLGWIPIYHDISLRLREKKYQSESGRQLLLNILYDGFNKEGWNSNPLRDQNPKGTQIRLEDVCPFTMIMFLNRRATGKNRNKLLEIYTNKLGVKRNDFEFVPRYDDSYLETLPLVRPIKVWFFPFKYERKDDDIKKLWDMFEAALDYADKGGRNKDQFIEAYNNCVPVRWNGPSKLSQALYSLRPRSYPIIDKNVIRYLEKRASDSQDTETRARISELGELTKKLTKDLKAKRYGGEEYLRITHGLQKEFQDEYSRKFLEKYGKADGRNYVFIGLSRDTYRNTESDKVKITTTRKTHHPLNQILYGPPGTGKTYQTRQIAVEIVLGKRFSSDNSKGREKILELYDEYMEEDRIRFVTFHQSYGYEEFVEGIKPQTKGINSSDDVDNSSIEYQVKPGIFRQICEDASADRENRYVLIIDEINRGNISKILGELITLLEDDKRLGSKEELRVRLPYSPSKKFGVPNNLYIIGTMNTTDRSIAFFDSALRRRFEFKEIMPNPQLLSNNVDGVNLRLLLEVINNRISDKLDREHQIGHSYFMSHKVGNKQDLEKVFRNNICPLLDEYFYDKRELIPDVIRKESNLIVEGKSGENRWEWAGKVEFVKPQNYKKIYGE